MSIMTTMSDADIDRAVTQELDWDPRVDSKGIAVSVRNGIVTLAGFVDSYGKKLAASEAAHNVAGVLDVADQVQVRPASMAKTDAELSQAVRHALIWDVFVPDKRIKSTVSNGWVTLEGDVDFSYQREDCSKVVQRLSGVVGVSNAIAVKAQRVDPLQVRTSIEKALARRAQREANALSIRVDDTTVRLGGKLRSIAEKYAVERVALNSPGVSKVENAITVDSNA